MPKHLITCFTLLLCYLGSSSNLVYAMDRRSSQEKLSTKSSLNVPAFLEQMKKKFHFPSQLPDLIRLKFVIFQYHPNKEDGCITGKNLKKLHTMSIQAQKYFHCQSPYCRMLRELTQAINYGDLQPEENSSSGEEYTICPICRGDLQNAIKLEASCSHTFCYKCLFKWYVRHEKSNVDRYQWDMHSCCPFCRMPIPEEVTNLLKQNPSYKKSHAKHVGKRRRERAAQVQQEHEDLLHQFLENSDLLG